MTVNIYLESSIRDPARTKSGVVGFVLQAGDTDATKTVFGIVESVTKNQADVICLKNAVSHINGKCDNIFIHTSSGYVYQSISSLAKNQKFTGVKFKEEWQSIYSNLSKAQFAAAFNEPNEFRSWLQQECERRAEKHGF